MITAENVSMRGRATPRQDEAELQPKVVSSNSVETDFAELDDGRLVEMVEDPQNPSRTVFAVWNGGDVHLTDRVQHRDQILVPIPRSRKIIQNVVLARGVKKYESLRFLMAKVQDIFVACLDLEIDKIWILTAFVLATWLIDRLPVAPYLALVGLSRSGKSTALELLNLMCRRSLLTADISLPALYRVCHSVIPTLLIDETEAALTAKKRLFHVLRSGTTRGVTVIRENESYKTFAAKVVCWTELPEDAALNSRCIVIGLHESIRADLKKHSSPEIVRAADELRQQLLQFRFQQYNNMVVPKIEAHGLRSRARDLYEALALPVGELDDFCRFLATALGLQQNFSREPLSPTHSAVLKTLFIMIHSAEQKGIWRIQDLTHQVNSTLATSVEKHKASPRKVGAVLSSFGLSNRHRSNRGWVVYLQREDRRRIHELMETYGVDDGSGMPFGEHVNKCEFCSPNPNSIGHSEGDETKALI